MNGFKKFGLILSVLLFGPLFLLSIWSVIFTRTIGDEAYAKETIAEAGFYEAVGETIITQAVGGVEAEPLIRTALEQAVSGQAIQTALEPLVGETYAWLRGDVQLPQFSLEIAPIKQNFESALTTALNARAASLPTCTSYGQLQGSDVFSYTCIPPGTDVNQVIADTVTRVTNNASVFSDEIVADGTLSANEAAELGVNDPTQNLPEQLPQFYQFLTAGQWFFIFGTLLTGVGIVLLSRTWLRGIRNLGILLLINGVLVLITGFILSFVVGSLTPTASVDVTESSVQALQTATRIILEDSASTVKLVGIVSVIFGVIGVVASTLATKRTSVAR